MQMGLSERRLRYFFEAVTAGSIRGAADRLGIEPSVVSRQIQQLEQELGLVLLERLGRGVAPTEAAELLMEHCRERHAGEETLLARLDELSGLQRGELNIVAGEGFADDLVHNVLAGFSKKHPNIRVTLQLAAATEAVREVAENRAHIGLALSPPPDPAIRIVACRGMPLCAIVWAGHPLLDLPAPISLADALAYPVGLMTTGFGTRQIVQLALFTEKATLQPAFTTNSIASLKSFVASGMGLTFLSANAIVTEAREGLLAAVPVASAALQSAEGCLMVRERRPLSGAAQRLLAYIHAMPLFGGPPVAG
jgi:DNA-binding transcriptional LysR family regulator